MLRPLAAAGLAAGLLAALPALAQTDSGPAAPSATSAVQVGENAGTPGGFVTGMGGGLMRSSKLVGLDVIGLDNVKVGAIDEVLMDGSGRVKAVVLGVGGFLGLGEKRVAVPFDLFLWNTGDVSRSAGPSASVAAGSAPGNPRVGTAAGAERMPGAGISNEVLNAGPERRSGSVDPSTGSAATAGPPATVTVTDAENGPERAIVRLTKADLEKAPAFRYDRDGGAAPGPKP
jgi:sporulation protein YlmC with PRC-barrel domain